jgi:2-desacetyl-2-hydroxyethyl bacteriochlorophyllide A dehydrogenase
MKAVVYRPTKGLCFEEILDPQAAADEVLIKIANTGFCGSDHSLIKTGWLPEGYVLGHEVSGVVAEKGPEVKGPDPGTKVIIRPTYCGNCPNCLSGRPHLCRINRRTIGIGDLPGGFAQWVKVFPQMVIPIPEGVDSHNAALAETFASALHGINCTGNQTGSVLVLGGGPIGLCAVRLLKLLGHGPVVILEPIQEKRTIACAFGADYVFGLEEKDVDQQLLDVVRGKGFDKVLECSGVPDSLARAIDLVADGGVVCMVSVIMGPMTIPVAMKLNLKEVHLMGSISNTHQENIQCLDWMAAGELDAHPLISDLIPLDGLPEIYLEKIETGRSIKVLLQIGEEWGLSRPKEMG